MGACCSEMEEIPSLAELDGELVGALWPSTRKMIGLQTNKWIRQQLFSHCNELQIVIAGRMDVAIHVPCLSIPLCSANLVTINPHEMGSPYGIEMVLEKNGASKTQRSAQDLATRFEGVHHVRVIGQNLNEPKRFFVLDKSHRHPPFLSEAASEDLCEASKDTVLELVTMSGIHHSDVVTWLEVLRHEQSVELVLRHMDGGSLRDMMTRVRDSEGEVRALSPGAVSVVGRGIACALETLHEMDVLHRDVTPSNVVLSITGLVKLADFDHTSHPGSVSGHYLCLQAHGGDVAATLCSDWAGSVAYMSPERATAGAYSRTADVWSLGLVLVEAAIGRHPLQRRGEDSLQFWDYVARVTEDPCPSTHMQELGATWAALAAVAARCLARDAAQRLRSRELVASAALAEASEHAEELGWWVRGAIQGSEG